MCGDRGKGQIDTIKKSEIQAAELRPGLLTV